MMMTTDPAVVGRRIAAARRALSLRPVDLAKRSGISADTIRGVERGKHLPGLYVLVQICTALHITPNDLVCEEADDLCPPFI